MTQLCRSAHALPDDARRHLTQTVAFALAEDIGDGDLTAHLIDPSSQALATLITREPAVMCGMAWADEVFRQLGGVSIDWQVEEGERVAADQVLCTLHGQARALLTGERTAMNFLQTLMATASEARRFADAAEGTAVTVLDTRKTLPGLRTAQKYAVRCGGCQNHRIGLYDAFLIKENHIAACGGIPAAIERARALAPDKKIIVEVESLDELAQAAALTPDQIMLDNFTPEMLQQALGMAADSALEISGNRTLDDLRHLPTERPLFLSSGALTKHCRAIDLSMRLTIQDD